MSAADVLVVGGGPAGAVAAKVLAQSGWKVLLTDAAAPAGKKIGESLPGAARPLLRDLGLLPWLEKSEPQPCFGNLSSWGSDMLVDTDFIRSPEGAGWHLDRGRFDACLREAALAEGAEWKSARMLAATREEDCWRVVLSDGEIKARWLVDASGRRAACARRLGIRRLRDEPLIALYAWGVNTAQDQRTLVESAHCGWWYTAPLPHGRRVAALHVGPEDAARILHSPDGWQACLDLTRHVRHLCRPDDAWSKPCAAEAGGSLLERCSGDGWIAVGDAALALDPLSSQGMFNALYTGLRGAQAIADALAGNHAAIGRYAAQLEQVRAAYRQHVKHYYQAERRWPDAPFWQSRSVQEHRAAA